LSKRGKRKCARPLSLRAPTHLVLKAWDRTLLFQNKPLIQGQIHKLSRQFGIRVYGLAVQSDHIHGVMKVPSRRLYRAWIRALAGTLARKIPGLKWKFIPFTKILTWGIQFKRALDYLMANQREADFLMGAWHKVQRIGGI
jgi:REP element-mobilizing transposase RayT